MSAGFNERPNGFSVGICATGDASGVSDLVGMVMNEKTEGTSKLEGITIVASDCDASSLVGLRSMSKLDKRVQLIEEAERRGKANAINKILRNTRTDILVLINADAHPDPGSISRILRKMESDPAIGVISASATPVGSGGLPRQLADLMWETHNQCALALNHMNLANHSSDELMAVRIAAIGLLPSGLVNDGAYMAGITRRKGYAVKFCQSAPVRVEVPSRLADFIGQRRRILFGHAQVWRALGTPPMTIESLMFKSPRLGISLLTRVVANRPRLLFALPLAFTSEVSAILLSMWDTLNSSKKHAVWRRYT